MCVFTIPQIKQPKDPGLTGRLGETHVACITLGNIIGVNQAVNLDSPGSCGNRVNQALKEQPIDAFPARKGGRRPETWAS